MIGTPSNRNPLRCALSCSPVCVISTLCRAFPHTPTRRCQPSPANSIPCQILTRQRQRRRCAICPTSPCTVNPQWTPSPFLLQIPLLLLISSPPPGHGPRPTVHSMTQLSSQAPVAISGKAFPPVSPLASRTYSASSRRQPHPHHRNRSLISIPRLQGRSLVRNVAVLALHPPLFACLPHLIRSGLRTRSPHWHASFVEGERLRAAHLNQVARTRLASEYRISFHLTSLSGIFCSCPLVSSAYCLHQTVFPAIASCFR